MGRLIVLTRFLRCRTAVTCYISFFICLDQRCIYASPKDEDLRLFSRTRSMDNHSPNVLVALVKVSFPQSCGSVYLRQSLEEDLARELFTGLLL